MLLYNVTTNLVILRLYFDVCVSFHCLVSLSMSLPKARQEREKEPCLLALNVFNLRRQWIHNINNEVMELIV